MPWCQTTAVDFPVPFPIGLHVSLYAAILPVKTADFTPAISGSILARSLSLCSLRSLQDSQPSPGGLDEVELLPEAG